MKITLPFSVFLILILNSFPAKSQDLEYNAPGTGNPLVPGYFADPTVKKFGDTYYMYATTDGVRLASGEPQVWVSKDFVNWYNQEMDIPYSLTNVWAPDMVLGTDGKYYYFHGNCEAGCNVYGYVGDTPLGPWTNIVGTDQASIPVNTVGTLPSLDQHYFVDDDDTIYAYFGTWISSNGGLGWAKIDPSDMVTILNKGQISMSELPEIFEAPYMLKRNGKYIMMYSSGDCQASSYRVQYAYGDSPTGPFTFGENNPILETNAEGSIDGPGHHCVVKEGDNYFIVYHRHDNPHSGGGEFRQVCADSLIFINDSTIKKVIPTNKGIGYLGTNQVTATDYAYEATTSATSYYHLVNGDNDYYYYPSYATDNNNGTMWRAASASLPQSLVVDLGSSINVKRVATQFEYATYYYQYKIEYSSDSASWDMFSDKTSNKASGSPMMDDGDVTARYIKITITGTEKAGMFPAIWNAKVYSEQFDYINLTPEVSTEDPGATSTKSLLVEINAKNLITGEIDGEIKNTGTLGGTFTPKGNPEVDTVYKVKSVSFDGNDYLKLSEKAPLSLSWNSPYTISAWVINPKVKSGECIVVWSKRTDNLMGEYAAFMYGTSTAFGAAAHWALLDMPYSTVPENDKWHNITLTFDGMLEKVYVDGVLNNQEQKNLFIHPQCDIIVGYSGGAGEYLSGSIASLRMYDKCFGADSIQHLMDMDSLDIDYDWVGTTPESSIKQIDDSKIKMFLNSANQLVIQNNKDDFDIEKVKVVDISGRTLLDVDYGLKGNEIALDIPKVDTFIVVLVSNTETFSKLISAY